MFTKWYVPEYILLVIDNFDRCRYEKCTSDSKDTESDVISEHPIKGNFRKLGKTFKPIVGHKLFS